MLTTITHQHHQQYGHLKYNVPIIYLKIRILFILQQNVNVLFGLECDGGAQVYRITALPRYLTTMMGKVLEIEIATVYYYILSNQNLQFDIIY